MSLFGLAGSLEVGNSHFPSKNFWSVSTPNYQRTLHPAVLRDKAEGQAPGKPGAKRSRRFDCRRNLKVFEITVLR